LFVNDGVLIGPVCMAGHVIRVIPDSARLFR
jgi:hypothetical protein